MEELLLLGSLMVGGFVAGGVLDRLGLPRAAGYVTFGALMSEPLLGAFVPGAPGPWAETITTVALGVIAFLVGAEIDLARLRAEEREVASVTAGQAVGTILFVTAAIGGATALAPGLFGGRVEWPVALVFAAIAAATAPAGTMAVIEQYGARGPLTVMVLGLVAIDDAVSVAAFTIAAGFAADGELSAELLDVGRELGLSLLAGAVLGLALGLFARHVHKGDLRLPPILAVVFLNVGLSEQLAYSDLLSSIVLGLVAMLVFRKPQTEWLEPIRHVEETIFLIFFVLAGSHFDPGVFASALPLILLYVVSRFGGKYAGAWLGAAAVGAKPEIRRWVGLTLMPHAGVAIGLALRASEMPGVRDTGELLLNVVIGSTLLFEVAGPWLAKVALDRAGEIAHSSS